jgi:transposase InsO family protein
MPWKQTDLMTERIKLITEHLSGDYSVSELARRHEVSRKSVYKWLERFAMEGWAGLEDQSRARAHQEHATKPRVEAAILALKARWPDWGAPKLRHKLAQQMGAKRCPAESTVSAILKRHGLVKVHGVRLRAVPGGMGPLAHCREANAVWCADFKGWWRTRDGQRCEPLTVTDAWSRYLLRCVGMKAGTSGRQVRTHFEMLFREYGLPEAIRTDNGAPFASVGLGGLTSLSVWWLRLGLRLERIRPGCPQENGRHERMHLSLEQSGARVARANLAQQQRALEVFRHEYNQERPHEALAQRVPAELYAPSPRVYPNRLPAPREYPEAWVPRQVRASGQIKWAGQDVSVSQALAGERIGLEPRGDGNWAVWFEMLELGLFDERRLRIQRHKHLPPPVLQDELP